MRILTIALLFISGILSAQSTIESIPNQKLIDGSYVSNPDSILSPRTVAEINAILRSLESRTTVQVAVVAVKSIGGFPAFTFGLSLFNTWQIGHKDNNNGLLILFVHDSRDIQFITGLGAEAVLPDATCKGVQRNHMVPHFREGNFDAGMLAGVKEVDTILSNPAYASELKAEYTPRYETPYWDFAKYVLFGGLPLFGIFFLIMDLNQKFADSKKDKPYPYPQRQIKRTQWLWLFGGFPLIIFVAFWVAPIPGATELSMGVLYLYFLGTVIFFLIRGREVTKNLEAKQAWYEATEFLRKERVYMMIMAVLFPLPFLPYYFIHLSNIRKYRNHPRKCKECSSAMTKLGENTEDAFLTKNQQLEETLKSVDYDVWQCQACNKTELFNYVNRFSSYDECISCKTRAVYVSSRRTVKEPTYSSEGLGEEIKTCKFCNKSSRSTYKIGRKEQKSAASSGFGGSRSSSSSGSSGGSWGGGRSGGGGAGSKW